MPRQKPTFLILYLNSPTDPAEAFTGDDGRANAAARAGALVEAGKISDKDFVVYEAKLLNLNVKTSFGFRKPV